MSTAERFKALRVSQGFPSQRSLAEASGVSQATIGHIESGRSQALSVTSVVQIARAMKLPVADVIGIFDDRDDVEQGSLHEEIDTWTLKLEGWDVSDEDKLALAAFLRRLRPRVTGAAAIQEEAIGVILSGGLVERVIGTPNQPRSTVVIIDFDTEGLDDDELTMVRMVEGRDVAAYARLEAIDHADIDLIETVRRVAGGAS